MKMIDAAVTVLKKGGIIAYPTEAVFGLGCDPFNAEAVARLLKLKNRSNEKGFILITDCFEKFIPFVADVPKKKLAAALATWPGPYTWIFPANASTVPSNISGPHKTLAIRVTAHPLAQQLCAAFGSPLISTSANFSSEPPLCNAESVRACFKESVDYVVEGETGGLLVPTTIRDLLTGEVLRW